MKDKIWYGDRPNRRCGDCGERADWDERLRLGHYAEGGPTHPDGITPLYDPARRYGNTSEGLTEQAKLETHYQRYHIGGLVSTYAKDGWRLEVHRYGASLAFGRKCLLARRPYYGVLSIAAPTGRTVAEIIGACQTPEEVVSRAGF